MDDLISRQDAVDAISECTAWKMSKDDKLISKVAVVNELLLLPSAQPEIIRCKDCCHYPGEYTDCPLIGWHRNEDDFCSFAEREEAMDDLISRRAAVDAVNELKEDGHVYINGDFFETVLRDEVRQMLEDLPSAQPEIIRCKDCKHWREGDAYSYCHKLFNCGVLDVYDYMRVEDDFCSIAERCEE